MHLMQICCPTLAIAWVFVCWQSYERGRIGRMRKLHERVAFMLWNSAHCVGGHGQSRIWHYHGII